MNKAIVLDLGLTGYGIVKCLGKENVPIIGVHASKSDSLAHTSKYVEDSFIISNEKTLDTLLKIGENLDEKGVLFVSSDYFVDFCSRHSEELKKYFHVPVSEKYSIHKIMFKGPMAEVATKSGLFVPKSVLISQDDSNIKLVLDDFPCPAIVKPGNSLQGSKGYMGIEKNNKDLYQRVMNTLEFCQDLIISEYIEGPGKNMREVLGFLNSDNNFVSITIQKLRQYPYLNLGFGTLEETLFEEDITEMTKQFSKEIDMKGLFHIEYKREENTNKPYFIEANFRCNSGICISEGAGMNIPYLYYLDTIGALLEIPKPYDLGVRWIGEHHEWELVESGQITQKELFGEHKNVKVCAVYDPKDPEPFRIHTSRNPLKIINEDYIKSLIK